MTTLEIQRRLSALGHDPGPHDGVRGRLTIRAIKAFQLQRGLDPDGIAGPRTMAALRGENALPPGGAPAAQIAPWYDEAQRLRGTVELSGSRDSPVILGWAKRLKIAYQHDSVAWCGLFAAHCIGASLPDEPLPTSPLGARNWLAFGRPVDPTLGAVLVFWRGSKASWSGHVGSMPAKTRPRSMCSAAISRTRSRSLASARRDCSDRGGHARRLLPESFRIRRSADASLSTNEA